MVAEETHKSTTAADLLRGTAERPSRRTAVSRLCVSLPVEFANTVRELADYAGMPISHLFELLLADDVEVARLYFDGQEGVALLRARPGSTD